MVTYEAMTPQSLGGQWFWSLTEWIYWSGVVCEISSQGKFVNN